MYSTCVFLFRSIMFLETLKETGLYQALACDFINSERVTKFGENKCLELLEEILLNLEKSPLFTTIRVNLLAVNSEELKLQLKTIFPQFDVVAHAFLPDVLVIPSFSNVTQPIPVETEVIVSLKCGLSVLRGASVYVPGILGAPKSLKKNDLVSIYCDVEGKCLRGRTQQYSCKKYYLGNGISLWDRRHLFVTQSANGIGVEMTEPIVHLPSLNGLYANSIFLQNLPSIVCGHVLNPKPGDTVLDMCAAPGGKTTHLATLMKDTGIVIALDKTEKKINSVKLNAERLGLQCISAFPFDATKCFSTSVDSLQSTIINGPPYGKQTFDKILLDAPCSCLGQRPQLVNKLTPKELNSYPNIQKVLLKNAIELVKINGEIVYSTCTFTIQENEANVKWVLDNFPQIKLIEQLPYFGKPGLHGAGLTDGNLAKLQRFGLPSSNNTVENDTIGFFIAKFIKQ